MVTTHRSSLTPYAYKGFFHSKPQFHYGTIVGSRYDTLTREEGGLWLVNGGRVDSGHTFPALTDFSPAASPWFLCGIRPLPPPFANLPPPQQPLRRSNLVTLAASVVAVAEKGRGREPRFCRTSSDDGCDDLSLVPRRGAAAIERMRRVQKRESTIRYVVSRY